MAFKITVPKEQLKIMMRVAGAASTDGSREALCSLRIEPGLMVATDGHILRQEDFEGNEVTGLITPLALKVASRSKSAYAELDVDTEAWYPQWRNVVPSADTETDGVHPWVRTETMSRFLKTMPGAESLLFRPTRDELSALRVYALRLGQPVFAGLVMPCRADVKR